MISTERAFIARKVGGLALFSTFSVLDLITTSRGLAAGGIEYNPLGAHLFATHGMQALAISKLIQMSILVVGIAAQTRWDMATRRANPSSRRNLSGKTLAAANAMGLFTVLWNSSSLLGLH